LFEKYIIASEKSWNKDMHISLNKKSDCEFILLSDQHSLNVENLRSINPKYIFFPHWSHIIPESIFSEFACVVFHMTDLPYGRGGSPLQNLILEGVEDTKITALKVVEELDAGPIYMKSPLNLSGSANDIYHRASFVIESMIQKMILEPCPPAPQTGEPTTFKRRTPKQSNIEKVDRKKTLFDMIRMLDADGYPHAFTNIDNFRIEFTEVMKNNGEISAKASFIKINDEV